MSYRDGRESPSSSLAPVHRTDNRRRVNSLVEPRTSATKRTTAGWDNEAMVETILWSIIGVVGIVGAILGLAAAFQMGRAPYRSK